MKHRLLTSSLTVVSATLAMTASLANATPTLIAVGQLTGSTAGSYADLSGLTGTLEDGSAMNLLGGIGSGLAWAGGNTFIAVPDRGPNASTYNPLVDNTTSYIDRFQTIQMALTATPGATLPFALTPTLTATTLFSSATPLAYGSGALGTDATHTLGSGVPALNAINNAYYFTGRSDNFSGSGSGNPANARLDPEGVRVSNDGRSVFVSDEYGPYVYQFDRTTGQRIRTFTLPSDLAVNTLGPTTGSEGAPTNTTGRIANKGMEGLAITPDGTTLVGVMQAPLLQDGGKAIRIVTIDIATGATKQYAYNLTDGSGVSEIVAVNSHVFLLDERDGKGLGDGSNAAVKKLYRIDLTGATPLPSNLAGTASNPNDLSAYVLAKTQVLDIRSTLVNAGIGITNALVPSKIEGVAFGQDVMLNGASFHTLWVANDNDFSLSTSGTNQFFVFAVTDADLGAIFEPQAIAAAVPEPHTYALFGAGIAVLATIARRRRDRPPRT
jgi:hypothetical protein